MTPTLVSRYAGTLVGAACGDALGATLEFMSRSEVLATWPGGLRDIVGGGWMGVEPGETTDDTAMMLADPRACDADGIDLQLIADNFSAWLESGPKDVGNATREAIKLLQEGFRWDEAGEQLQRRTPQGVTGNGTVIRWAPIALRFRTAPEKLVSAAIDAARITHADPRATWGAVAVCQAIAHLLNGGAIDGGIEAAIHEVRGKTGVEAVESAGIPRDGGGG